MNKKSTIIFSIVLLNTSLITAQTKFEEKKVGHEYYISIPEYMTKTLELNDVALAQYQNIEKEIYCIVIEDSKEDLKLVDLHFNSADEFYEDFILDYKSNFETNEVKNKKIFKVGNNSYIQCDFTYDTDEVYYSMLITIVETKNYYYKVLSWTIPEYKEKYRSEFEKIALSLRD
jgi:hypothetical protein